MDKFFPALFVLLLLAFAAIAAVEACAKPDKLEFRELQDAAVWDGKGEYYFDAQGKERFRYFKNDRIDL